MSASDLQKDYAIESIKESWWDHFSKEEQDNMIEEFLDYMYDCYPVILERLQDA